MKHMMYSLALVGMALCVPLASQAGAEPRRDRSLLPEAAAPDHHRVFNFRIIEDPVLGPTPTHNSGMIVQTDVTSNAIVGFGMLSVSARRPSSGEWRNDGRSTRSRKAAVQFRLRF